MSATTDSIVDDVFGGERPPKHSVLPQRSVAPWHKPRKQWIRRHQWLSEINQLCNRIEFRDGRPLRYLSLPGIDLLDVRVIRECCEQRGLKLKYLGLNDKASSDTPDTWLNIANHEVKGSSSIHRDSQVIHDHFERLAVSDSHAGEYMKTYGPFDVVNLDLCSSLSPRGSGRAMPNLYSALHVLTDFQKANRPPTEPWLLLITSRASESSVLRDHMDLLNQCVRKNVNDYPEFASQLDALVQGGTALVNEDSPNWGHIPPADYVSMFSIGVGKWLLQRLVAGSPRCGVKMLGSYSYRVYGKVPDMVSYAFLIEGHVQSSTDAAGLSTFTSSSLADISEGTIAVGLIESVKSITDLDKMLYEQPLLYEKMKNETLELLKSARYVEAEILAAFDRFDDAANRAFQEGKPPIAGLDTRSDVAGNPASELN